MQAEQGWNSWFDYTVTHCDIVLPFNFDHWQSWQRQKPKCLHYDTVVSRSPPPLLTRSTMTQLNSAACTVHLHALHMRLFIVKHLSLSPPLSPHSYSFFLSPISLFLIAPLLVILSLTLTVYVSIFLSLTLSPMSLPLGLSTSLTPISSDYVTYKTVPFRFYVHYLLPILSPTVNGFFNCCTLFSRYQIPIFAIFFWVLFWTRWQECWFRVHNCWSKFYLCYNLSPRQT